MNKKFHMTPAKLTAALFAVILLTVPIVTIALPKQERSENENRTLAKFPDIVNHTKMDKAENLGDVLGAIRWDDITTRDEDSWMDKFETYFSDHLVGREDWVRARNEMEKLAGKKEINGVYTVDDQMIQAFKTYDKSDVESSLNAMNRFAYITLCMAFLAMISMESETSAVKVSIIKSADPVKRKVYFCYYRLAKGIRGILSYAKEGVRLWFRTKRPAYRQICLKLVA